MCVPLGDLLDHLNAGEPTTKEKCVMKLKTITAKQKGGFRFGEENDIDSGLPYPESRVSPLRNPVPRPVVYSGSVPVIQGFRPESDERGNWSQPTDKRLSESRHRTNPNYGPAQEARRDKNKWMKMKTVLCVKAIPNCTTPPPSPRFQLALGSMNR